MSRYEIVELIQVRVDNGAEPFDRKKVSVNEGTGAA